MGKNHTKSKLNSTDKVNKDLYLSVVPTATHVGKINEMYCANAKIHLKFRYSASCGKFLQISPKSFSPHAPKRNLQNFRHSFTETLVSLNKFIDFELRRMNRQTELCERSTVQENPCNHFYLHRFSMLRWLVYICVYIEERNGW